MNDFEQESHKHSSQNRASQAFELIKLELFIFEMTNCFTRYDPYSSSGVIESPLKLQ